MRLKQEHVQLIGCVLTVILGAVISLNYTESRFGLWFGLAFLVGGVLDLWSLQRKYRA